MIIKYCYDCISWIGRNWFMWKLVFSSLARITHFIGLTYYCSHYYYCLVLPQEQYKAVSYYYNYCYYGYDYFQVRVTIYWRVIDFYPNSSFEHQTPVHIVFALAKGRRTSHHSNHNWYYSYCPIIVIDAGITLTDGSLITDLLIGMSCSVNKMMNCYCYCYRSYCISSECSFIKVSEVFIIVIGLFIRVKSVHGLKKIYLITLTYQTLYHYQTVSHYYQTVFNYQLIFICFPF